MNRLNPRASTPGKLTIEDLTPGDRQAVLEFQQFLRWAKTPNTAPSEAPYRYLAQAWYQGFITVEEGKSIEREA